MKQFDLFELTFQGVPPTGDQVDVDLKATFSVNGRKTRVQGFYAGNGEYKVRYLPTEQGLVAWEVSGLFRERGEEICDPSAADSHGLVHAEGTYFRYQDGTWFMPFGTTVYALIHQEDKLVDMTMATLAGSPFNKVRFCVFPKSYEFNQNEPLLFAFEKNSDGKWNVQHPCFAFWTRLEDRLAQLVKMGIQADIILFHPYDRWGFAKLSQRENLLYLDYLIRRLAAFPNVWWSLANEFDLCPENKSMEDWFEIEEFVAEHDPYGHLLSNHNCLPFWDFTRPNVTHVSVQTKRLFDIPAFLERYQKPVMIDECCYEGNIAMPWGSISGQEMTARFWRTFVSGGYCTHGETFYDENDILWWAKGGVLKGESPKRIAFLKRIAEELPGPLDPMEDGFGKLVNSTDAELAQTLEHLPAEAQIFVRAVQLMTPEDRRVYALLEHSWAGHCGDDVFLWYLDTRTCSKFEITLPEGHTYRVEVIDTWKMSRETVLSGATGKVNVDLPGSEYTTILAVAE